MRRELLEAVLRDVFAPKIKGVAFMEVARIVEGFMRDKGMGEMEIARKMGEFRGNYFRKLEAAKG